MDQIMRCKNCGAEIDLRKAIDGVVECEYCFSKFTVPKEETPDATKQYLHDGESNLNYGDFDKAMACYQKAAELSPKEPEAYFGMALAEFGVRYLNYVTDDGKPQIQPICHRVADREFIDSPYYMKAYMRGTPRQQAEYARQAEEIDYIRKEFFNLEKSGLNYDCFICVKVTDFDGTRTDDYKIADDIYFDLKGRGYKPFFSEREINKSVIGSDYEARILYALTKSECMLVVCSNEEYLNTVWVKNEYTRFLRLVNDEQKESDSIAIVYNGRPIERLAGKKGRIQGIDIAKFGSSEKIVAFVEAHTPAAREKRAAEERAKAEEAKAKAEENELLRKIIADYQLKEQSNAQSAPTPAPQPAPTPAPRPAAKPFPSNKNYGGKITFGHYPQTSADSLDPIKWRVLSCDGDRALLLSEKILDIHVFNTDKTNNYEKSELRSWLNGTFFNTAFDAEEKAFVLDTAVDNSPDSTGNPFTPFACNDTVDKVFPLSYREVSELIPDPDSAGPAEKSKIRVRGLTQYALDKDAYKRSDSRDLDGDVSGCWWLRSPGSKSNTVCSVLYFGPVSDNGERADFTQVGVVPAITVKFDEKFKQFLREAPEREKRVAERAAELKKEKARLAAEQEAREKAAKAEQEARERAAKQVVFGQYPQETETPEPIHWTIIETNGDEALLLSDKILDSLEFSLPAKNNYAKSKVRKWLNEEFLTKAFTPREQEKILLKKVDNSESSYTGTFKPTFCEDTYDKVFLLSECQAKMLGISNKTKDLLVKEQTAHVKYLSKNEWWLRTPSISNTSFKVEENGYVSAYGGFNFSKFGIVPAIWVKLDAEFKQISADAQKAYVEQKQAAEAAAKQQALDEAARHINFGRYPQSSATSVEPISWRIMQRIDDKVLIFADKILDGKRFNEYKKPKLFDKNKVFSNNYANSELRQWLNGEFYSRAFSEEEKKSILTVVVDNSPASTSEDGNKYACENTNDKVFLLSEHDVFGIKDFELRRHEATPYAIQQGVPVAKDPLAKVNPDRECGEYWLRSPFGKDDGCAYHIQSSGMSWFNGHRVDDVMGVVPAMWIILPKK